MAQSTEEKAGDGKSASDTALGCGCLVVVVVVLFLGYVAWLATREAAPLGLSPRYIVTACRGFEAEDPNSLFRDEEQGVYVALFADRWMVQIKADSMTTPSEYAEIETSTAREYAEAAALFVASVFSAVPGQAEHMDEAADWVRNRWDGSAYVRPFGDLTVSIRTVDGRVKYVRVSGR